MNVHDQLLMIDFLLHAQVADAISQWDYNQAGCIIAT